LTLQNYNSPHTLRNVKKHKPPFFLKKTTNAINRFPPHSTNGAHGLPFYLYGVDFFHDDSCLMVFFVVFGWPISFFCTFAVRIAGKCVRVIIF
jgi:hypothetical protein